MDPDELHGLAGRLLAYDAELVEGRRQVLQRARSLFQHYGYHPGFLTHHLRTGRVEDDVPALDVVARTVMHDFPEHFAGQESDPGARLLALFAEGPPRPMSREQAYRQALDQLRELACDSVPF